MQSGSSLAQLERAIAAVAVEDPFDLDVEWFTRLVRQLDSLHARVISVLDDVAAARCIGSSVRQVRAQRALMSKLEYIPEARRAVEDGALSLAQADVVVRNPEVAAALVASAPDKSIEEFRECAAKLQDKSAESEAERYRRLRRNRSLRHWIDGEGLVNTLIKQTPNDAALFHARLRGMEYRLARDPDATPEAHRADAFAALFDEPASQVGRPPKTVVNIHVDSESLSRGWVESDGFCEVAGLGSIPVTAVHDIFEEAVVRVLLKSNNKLLWSGDLDKPLPDRVKAAVNAGNRHRCARCGDQAVDVDHALAQINGGDHELPNLQPLCRPCHKVKTLTDAPWSAKYYAQTRPPGKTA